MGPLTISVGESRYTLEPRNFRKITLISARPPLAVSDILQEAHSRVNSVGVVRRKKTWAAYLSQFTTGRPYGVWMCQDRTRIWAALDGLDNYQREEDPRGELLIVPADWQLLHHLELRVFWKQVLKKVYAYDMGLLVDARLADSVNWLLGAFQESAHDPKDIRGLVVAPRQEAVGPVFRVREVEFRDMWEKAGKPKEDWR